MEDYEPRISPDRPQGKWEGIDYRYYKQPKMKCVNCGSRYFKCLGVHRIEIRGTVKEESIWLCKTCGKSVTKSKEK